jgi:membrane protease YdiL (CAAX protease family)
MKAFLNRFPAWAEFAIVVGCAFGYFIVTSLYSALHPVLLLKPHHTNLSLIVLGIVETAALVLVGSFLWARGWTAARLGLRPTFADTGMGAGLALVTYVAYIAAWFVFALSVPTLAEQAMHVTVVSQGIALSTALIVPWINGLYEEVFVAGYIITALKERHSLWFAINVSVGVRLAYHLYQGALGVVVVVPLGLIFGYWYARNGRLWPLVVAHALIDLVGMLASVQW